MKRIFIMSSERSGSNLLRSMFGAQSCLIAPPAVHFTTYLARFAACYGDLRRHDSMRALVGDLVDLARANIEPWPWCIDLDATAVAADRRDFWGAVIALYDSAARLEGKSGWVCKDNALFQYAAELMLTPDLQFIYLVRDGRDAALSFFKAPFGPRTVTVAAKQWKSEQLDCMRIAAVFPGRISTIRYEDLIDCPEDTLRRLCRRIGIKYEPGMMSFHQSNVARSMSRKSDFWSNLDKPLIKGNHSKWKTEMTRSACLYYQHIAGLPLAYHGYEIVPGEVPRIATAVRPLIDHALDLGYKLMRRAYHLEKPKRAEKVRVHTRIVERLTHSTCENMHPSPR